MKGLKFKTITNLTYSPLGMACFGFFFSLSFQDMGFWGGVKKGVPITLLWYWVGAVLSYSFTLLSIILICIKIINKKVNKEDYVWILPSAIFIFATVTWTTFIIIAGQSGF